MNVYQVDESDEGEALLQNKLLVRLNKDGVPRDKYVFDYSMDDTFKSHSAGKVNTRIVFYPWSVLSPIHPRSDLVNILSSKQHQPTGQLAKNNR